jgi:ATP-dependent Lhr-like helicase
MVYLCSERTSTGGRVMLDSLGSFHPVLRKWFLDTFGSPTPPQEQGWPKIDQGDNVLLLAATGSGKTLAAFFKCLDVLYKKLLTEEISAQSGVQVLYVSPLKALNNDIHKNLKEPLKGIAETGAQMGISMPEITAAVRTGDTPSNERQKMLRKPPHILITTPESLFLMLSSKSRDILRTVKFVIIDEIHNLFPNKRGCHLSLSLERLEHLVGPGSFQRIGLSATVNPVEEVAQFLVGHDRPCTILDSGQRKDYDLQIELPVADLRLLPEKSIWPAVYKRLLELIREHSTTLVFVNNRRLAERLAVNLNQLAGEEVARTHHGSISKEMRLESEDLLKQGKIPCIVATSSLELGIDVGHIDLVVQVESPKEVARGIQRVGRAGHVVGLPSKARIIPKTRLDLLESFVMLEAMRKCALEPCQAPRNCLDILAQQLVAMTTERTWSPQEMYDLCTASYNFCDLKWDDFERVLQMLAGAYESDQTIDLRPRLHWDRLHNVVSMDSYGRQLIYSNSGTIPNRGYYGVYLKDGGPKLGELDEEFVYERRLGERFLLGTTVWRIEELRQDRVVVSRTQGQGPNVPFWKGETVGRSFSFGKHLGAFLAEAEEHLQDAEEFMRWLGATDPRISRNLFSLLKSQQNSTGRLPTDQLLVQEEFLDEMGDWHICLHSPLGTKLHILLALLVGQQIQTRTGLKVETIPADNGILIHAPGSAQPPSIDWTSLFTVDLRERIAELISPTSLFGITFRHIAQRSLVMALLSYGKKRTPLWLSRLKAGDLLQVVSNLPDFPLVMETYREILQDYFCLEDLEGLLRDLSHGRIKVHEVRNQTPSPFAHEHLFRFVGTQMYTDGTPVPNEKKLYGMGHEKLHHLLGEGLVPVLREDAILSIEARLQGRDALLAKPCLERTQYWLERIGSTTWNEIEEHFPGNLLHIRSLVMELLEQGKAVEMGDLIVAALYCEEYQEKLQESHLRSILLRYAKCHGPFSALDVAQRSGASVEDITNQLRALQKEGLVEVHGDLWCNPWILKEIHNLSLNKERQEVQTADFARFRVFLATWQGVQGKRDLHAVLDTLKDLWLPLSKLESHILPVRVEDYSPSRLDQLLSSGLLAWRAKQVGKEIFVRFEQNLPGIPPSLPSWIPCPSHMEVYSPKEGTSPLAQQMLQALKSQGALNLIALSKGVEQGVSRIWEDLSQLMLDGLVSNDTLGPLRVVTKVDKNHHRALRSLIESSVLGQMGRFFLLPPTREFSSADLVNMLLERFGIVTREMAVAETWAWSDLFPILDYLETIGEVKRGYFVEGLSGIQFAKASAVSMLNEVRLDPTMWWVLSKEDPAYPGKYAYEQVKGGSFTVFRGGEPVIVAEGRKLSLSIVSPLEYQDLRHGLSLLLQTLYPLYPNEKIVVTQVNDLPATICPELAILKTLGFEEGYGEAILWPTQRS